MCEDRSAECNVCRPLCRVRQLQCRVQWPQCRVCSEAYVSSMMAPLRIFPARCVITSMLHTRGDGLNAPVPIAWPPRAPDLNPCDFFVWGHLKSLVYASPVNTPGYLIARIVVAAAD
ncbi:hypothetical protein AVEN_13138-1 [Araneus ventricosus]|uniref:Uncharacterized protein n=1 Tax=Araneus ventricosus TaxID=182803 RepID=A0A4Y2T5L6_ARAVE|nr:hypothetical protein AVEN_13138-1 [Araneus ventricosus]